MTVDRPAPPRGSGAGASSRSWAAAGTGRRSEASSSLAWRRYLGGLPHLAASRRTDSAGGWRTGPLETPSPGRDRAEGKSVR
jgi:hypothetical protein